MKKHKKLNKDAKIAALLLSAFFVVLLMYAVNAFYLSSNGTLETEFLISYNENNRLAVNGFAVRDESKLVDGKNTCLLSKNDSYIYVPVISDSENVSKKGVIALAFASEGEADAYMQEQELKEKLASIKELERSEDLSYSNILFLNSQLNMNVSGYLSCLENSSVSELDGYVESITNNLTSKQIATGKDLDYKTIINDYNKQIKALKSSYRIVDRITSPYAGYFVSGTDGYENTFDFKLAQKKQVEKGQGEKLISAAAEVAGNIYGKIILQHTWYYIFDAELNDVSTLKNGYWVSVSFDDLGIRDLDMQVYDITEIHDGKVTVALRCTSMNEELAKIRKETAKITINQYDGFKISNEALTENEDGVPGVYAVVGNIMKFSPVEVEFYGDGYVVATGKRVLRDENDEGSGYYHVLRQYDKIIVKGMNLEDGSIVK